jgi:predicted Zn finger-like uncharacterized protein
MIVDCPKCGKKYQIPEEKLGAGPRRLRCRSCSEVFTITSEGTDRHGKEEPVEEDAPTRARRLARVLASDMVVYNKDMVEKARHDGNLLSLLGTEIERSWQLWKSRFPEQSADRIDIFRDALKDVLARGGDDFDDWTP